MSIPVQCTRCRNKHEERDRISKPRDKLFSDLVCPRCGCKSFYDLRPQVAWCWASGLIEIGDAAPADHPDGGGPIVIATGPKAYLKSAIAAVARHGYGKSAGQLLVPGVPEAEGQTTAADALAAWLRWCRKGRTKHGVEFTREVGAP